MRSTKMLCAAILAAGAFSAACDDGGGGGAGPEASAANSVDSAQAAHQAASDPGDEEALGALTRLYADLQGVTAGGSRERGTAMGALTTAQQALSADCMETTGNTTTYTDCAVEGTTLNGTVTADGDVSSFDVTFDVSDAAGASAPAGTSVEGVTVRETGQLTFDGSTLSGTVNANIDISIDISGVAGASNIPGAPSTAEMTTTVKAVFDAVTLDADGCATGGTLTVTTEVAGLPSSPGAGAMEPVVSTATFGPACGDVVVE